MSLNLGDEFPNLHLKSTHGEFDFYEWQGTSWVVVMSHPADFTPVCTTELARVLRLCPEFSRRDVKLLALSVDSLEHHHQWVPDIAAVSGVPCVSRLPFPIVEDRRRRIAIRLGMLDADTMDPDGLPLTCRSVLVVGPDRRLKLSVLYPSSTGRNFDEILRAIDSLQLTHTHHLATPADWRPGDNCLIPPSSEMTNDREEAVANGAPAHPTDHAHDNPAHCNPSHSDHAHAGHIQVGHTHTVHLPSGIPYMRFTACPPMQVGPNVVGPNVGCPVSEGQSEPSGRVAQEQGPIEETYL